MSTYEKQPPIHRVRCDAPECDAEFEPVSAYSSHTARDARIAARHAGWDVPPRLGKGSRSQEDFCPEHRRR
jgi:hypothetical protein